MPRKAPFDYPNENYMCMDCGEILSGPHTGEHNPDFRRTDVYKGTPHSSALCDDCERKRHTQHIGRKLYKRGLLGR